MSLICQRNARRTRLRSCESWLWSKRCKHEGSEQQEPSKRVALSDNQSLPSRQGRTPPCPQRHTSLDEPYRERSLLDRRGKAPEPVSSAANPSVTLASQITVSYAGNWGERSNKSGVFFRNFSKNLRARFLTRKPCDGRAERGLEEGQNGEKRPLWRESLGVRQAGTERGAAAAPGYDGYPEKAAHFKPPVKPPASLEYAGTSVLGEASLSFANSP